MTSVRTFRRGPLAILAAVITVSAVVLAGCSSPSATPAPAPSDKAACAALKQVADSGLYTASTPAAQRRLAAQLTTAADHTTGTTKAALENLAASLTAEANAPGTPLTSTQLDALAAGANTVADFAITTCHLSFPTPPAAITTPGSTTPPGSGASGISGTGGS